jgi:hypothetical protein
MWRIPIVYLVATMVLKGILSDTLKGIGKNIVSTPLFIKKQIVVDCYDDFFLIPLFFYCTLIDPN